MLSEGGPSGLRDYLQVLRRRKLVVILALVAVVGTTVLMSTLQTPVYQGRAKILLQPRSTESLFNPNTGARADPQRVVDTEIEVLESQPVRQAVREQLGAAPKVAASGIGRTDVIEIRAESTDPKAAANIANAYATAYIDFRRKQAVDDILAAGQEIQSKIGDLQRQIDNVNVVLMGGPPNLEATQQKEALVQQQTLFKQRLDQLQVDAALKTGGAQLVTRADVPTTPIKPTPVRSAAVALVVGLGFGIAMAFLIEYLDDSIKTKEDLERLANNLPVLGVIPVLPGWKLKEEAQVVLLREPKSIAAEAYRTLRTAIQFLAVDRPLRTLQVTSASAGEGKTTTVANLGVALARTGQRVIVVCCDLRRPRIHEFFGLSNKVGFTSVLLGKAPLSAAVQPVPNVDRLFLVASGPLPPNPSELLSSNRTAEILNELMAVADIVLFDSPPVLPVTDASVLSRRVDATLMVCSAGSTTRKQAASAVELLQRVEAPLVGLVLNGVGAEQGAAYHYYYHHGDDGPQRRRRRRDATTWTTSDNGEVEGLSVPTSVEKP